MAKIEVEAFKCERCGHVWTPRGKGAEPRVCPKCKSPYWNVPRRSLTYSTTAKRTRPLAVRETGLVEKAPVRREDKCLDIPGPKPGWEHDDSFWHPKTFEELAKEQGILAPQKWEDLTGGWPEGADFEEFMEAIRRARSGD
ncbi:MAG: hypothetical protein HYX92_17460 [Chloroflexi bacterium]|nr:hypothetical protein [Chloroflexota bacterium]